jgi:flavin-dependent dehydrogenase
MADYDLAIIGGGLNGVSLARDAAGRGLVRYLMRHEWARASPRTSCGVVPSSA